LKFAARKGCFLRFECEKANLTTFAPLEKFLEKSTSGPPLEKNLPTQMGVHGIIV